MHLRLHAQHVCTVALPFPQNHIHVIKCSSKILFFSFLNRGEIQQTTLGQTVHLAHPPAEQLLPQTSLMHKSCQRFSHQDFFCSSIYWLGNFLFLQSKREPFLRPLWGASLQACPVFTCTSVKDPVIAWKIWYIESVFLLSCEYHEGSWDASNLYHWHLG
jgi:hypothetical protein